MAEITAEAVARFFQLIWPLYDPPGGVVVELIRPWAKSCPIQSGFLGWDGRAHLWRIVARPYDEDPRHLLGCLFHELRHVLRGDIQKQPVDFEALRALARGQDETQRRREVVRLAVTRGDRQPMEDDCTEWGDREAGGWWPTLESWKDPVKAAKVAWWVYESLRQQGRLSEL